MFQRFQEHMYVIATSLRDTLTFGLYCNAGLLGLESAPWRMLHTALERFRTLRIVKFQRETKEVDDYSMAEHVRSISAKWQEFVAEKLPSTHKAGLLRFS